MSKLLNFNYIYIYIVALFLAVGCTKESLSPDQTDAVLALSHIDNPETPDPDPEVDCKCYMSITGVERFGLGLTTIWSLLDVTHPYSEGETYFIEGRNDKWYREEIMNYWSLPSPFWELSPPSNGWHDFELTLSPTPSSSGYFNMSATVRCYIQNGDGSETLATTTYHTFNWSEGTPVPPNSRRFSKFFSCLVQGEDPPKEVDDN